MTKYPKSPQPSISHKPVRALAAFIFVSLLMSHAATADFPVAGASAQRAGYVRTPDTLEKPEVRWEFPMGVVGESNTQPVVDGDGNVYVTAAPVNRKTWTETSRTPEGVLISLAPDGSERWRYSWTWNADDPARQGSWSQLSGPVLTPDGRVVMGFRQGHLRCWDKDSGEFRWERDLSPENNAITSTPVVDRAGNLYVHCKDIPKVFKLDEDGKEIWAHTFVDGVPGHSSSPSLSHDENTLYIGRMAGTTGAIYAINTADGAFTWAWKTECDGDHAFAWSIPSVGVDGTVYLQDESSTAIHAVHDGPRGAEWRWSVEKEGRSAPRLLAVDGEGIYSSYTNGHPIVLALNSDGSERWSYALGEGADIGGMVVSQDTLYFGVNGTGKVYALETQTGTVRWIEQLGTEGSHFSEGLTLTSDGILYAPVSATASHPDSPTLVSLRVAEDAAHVALTRESTSVVYLEMPPGIQGDLAETIEDFRGAIERASGVRIPMEARSGLLPLWIGEVSSLPSAEFAVPALEEQSAFLRVAPEGIWVIGGSPLGTQHGLYTLLHNLGFRWIMPGDIGECLPAAENLDLPLGARVVAPDFRYRELACGSNSREGAKRLELWKRRNRMYAPPVMQGHNLTHTLARLATFEDRPDLYALLEGERKATQVCTSNPETVALIIQSVSEYLDAYTDVEAYSLCPDDNFYFCECDACRALDVGHRDRGGLPSVSDRYQVFLNQVLEGLAASHPEVLVTTYSYNPNHTDPPQQTPVHPNTAVFCAPNVFCSIHGVGDAACASQQDLHALLTEWSGLTEHLYLFEYDPEPYCGGLPWPLWRAHAGSYPRFKELGVKGSFIAAQSSWAPYFLSYYVAPQLLWDSGQEADALYSDILHDFFGPAAPHMRSYYDTIESEFRAFSGTALWGMLDYPRYFPQAVAKEANEALMAAEAMAVSETIQQRLRMVRLAHEMFDAYLGIRTGRYANYAEYRVDIDRFDEAVNELVARNDDFLNATYARAKTGIAMSERFAEEQGFVNRWLICGPFDNLGMDGHDRVYGPELELDFSAIHFGKNDAPAEWRPNRTPDGTAYVRLADEYAVTDWVCAYAVCWVKNDGPPMDVEFRVGSNDSVKVFLNEDLIWDNKVERVASVDNDIISVTLPRGVSTIMLKVGQAGYDWGFFFRIARPGASELPEGLTVSDVPMPRDLE